MNLEILGSGKGIDSLLVTVTFNCRQDMRRFQAVYAKIMELFPEDGKDPSHEQVDCPNPAACPECSPLQSSGANNE